MVNMNNKCEGIVLRQNDYRDSDMILSVYTKEYGKMSFLARGLKKAKSKNASSCTLFCNSIFHFNDNGKNTMQTLKNAERIKLFHHIYEDLLLQTMAQLMCECVEKVADDKNEELYDVLYKSLNYLNEGKNPYIVLGLFMAKCNGFYGISPNVDECVKCHSKSNIASLSLRDGGFLCIQCMDPLYHKRYSENALRTFRLFHKAGIDDLSILEEHIECTYEDINTIIAFFEEYSGIHLKSKSFLDKIITM